MCYENGKLITGAKDSKVIIFSGKSGDLKLEKTVDMGESSPRGIDYFNGKLLVGLRNGFIYEFLESNPDAKKLVMASHHEGESWGLAMIHDEGLLFSIGDDNKIMAYDFREKKFLNKGTIAVNGSKNQEKIKKVTASTLSIYPPN
jgi:hypothetical protein